MKVEGGRVRGGLLEGGLVGTVSAHAAVERRTAWQKALLLGLVHTSAQTNQREKERM
jgi:hypothetical protein